MKHRIVIFIVFIISSLNFDSYTQNQVPQEEGGKPAVMPTIKSVGPVLELMDINLVETTRNEIIKHLNVLLSNEFIVYVKTLGYHWNIQGMLFGQLHEFFGELYKQQLMNIDRLAERIRALGAYAPGSMKEILSIGLLKEQEKAGLKDMDMIRSLLNDYEANIKSMRSSIKVCQELGDEGTANLLAELIVVMEKAAWMLRSYVH